LSCISWKIFTPKRAIQSFCCFIGFVSVYALSFSLPVTSFEDLYLEDGSVDLPQPVVPLYRKIHQISKEINMFPNMLTQRNGFGGEQCVLKESHKYQVVCTEMNASSPGLPITGLRSFFSDISITYRCSMCSYMAILLFTINKQIHSFYFILIKIADYLLKRL
jgi:hypothetical protein